MPNHYTRCQTVEPLISGHYKGHYKGHFFDPMLILFTSKIGPISLQGTQLLAPKCPLFRGSTVFSPLAIDLLVPYTGDYFDMVLRFDTFWRYHPTPTYTVKHMLLEQPPFSGKLRKLYVSDRNSTQSNSYLFIFLCVQIYKNGVVSFGKRMSFSSRNGGPPHISANGSLSFENAEVHFFVNPSNSQFSKRQDHIMNLLKLHVNEGVDGFKLRNMVVITWSNVNETTCNKVRCT